MNKDHVTDRTTTIYLQVAERARLSKDCALVHSMLLAAYDQVSSATQVVDLKTLAKLAELLVMENLEKQAEIIFETALANIDSVLDDNWLRARIYDGLAEIYSRQSHYEKARKKYEQAIRIFAKLPGLDPTLLSSRKRKLALISLRQGDNQKAHALFQQAAALTSASGNY